MTRGNWYYLYTEGSMAKDNTINGWYVDEHGEWVPSDADHIAYIFYQLGVVSGDKKHSFDEEAMIEADKLKERYSDTQVILLPVTSPEEFKNAWGNMDDKSKIIDLVEIILHGTIDDNPDDPNDGGTGFMYFEDEREEPDKIYRIAANNNMVRDRFPDINIHDLEHKKINELYFSSCNYANSDAEENTASAFSDVVDANTIIGWDGGSMCQEIVTDGQQEKDKEK